MKAYIQPKAIACDVLVKDMIVISIDEKKADENIPVQVPEKKIEETWEWEKTPVETENYWE